MRISDWSSDVCSSDLLDARVKPTAVRFRFFYNAGESTRAIMLAKRVAVGSAEAQIAAIPSLSPGQRAEAASRNPIANPLTSPAGPLLPPIFFNRGSEARGVGQE